MEIKFFDDPLEGPKPRHEVRLRQLGLYLYDDKRRVALGFDITPFLERPSVEVTAVNERGQVAGALTVIETLEANFTMVMHLRDNEPTDSYTITATLYYASPDEERMDVHQKQVTLDLTKPGDQTQP